MHGGIEYVLRDGKPHLEALGYAHELFFSEADKPEMRWTKIQRAQTCLDHITTAFTGWYERVLPVLGTSLHIEEKRESVVYADEDREITLVAIPDLVDEQWGILDWKISDNRDKYGKREGWQLQRFALQPTVFTFMESINTLYTDGQPYMPAFHYVRLDPINGEVQWLECKRDAGDWNFLIAQMVSIAKMIEADLPAWPLNDQHALCSPNWCLNWDQCKGSLTSELSASKGLSETLRVS